MQKKDVLLEALRRLDKKAEECVLIGDTKFDALGAKVVGMECVGVSYGYGTKEELMDAGAKAVLMDVKEVKSYLEKY